MRAILLALTVLTMTACGRTPSCPIISHRQALRMSDVYEGEIIKVWDGLHASKDPKVSHLIEVQVTGGKKLQGQRIAFPYDEWSVGKPPPDTGETVVFAPMQWVAVDPRSMGRPKTGW